MSSYALANPLPWWGAALAIAACGAIAWHAYGHFRIRRLYRNALIGLRFGTLLAIVIFLMRPVRTGDQRLHDVIVPVLVDVSRSMSIADVDSGAARIDRARDLLTHDILPALTRHFQADVLSFGDRIAAASPGTLAATARRSDLAGAITAVRERFRGRPVAGMILLSDGGETAVSAFPTDVPVYPIGIGSPAIARDREVLSVTAAEAVFDAARVDLAVSAVSHGHGVDPIPLQLLENGRPIEVRRVTPSADGVPIRAIFQASPPRGAATVYSVEIPAAPGELVAENNVRRVLVQPPARPRHVLFVEGAPGFEHSFLKRAWSLDPGLDVDAIVRKGKNEQGADTFYIQASQSATDILTSGFPQRAEDLFRYDVIVLANVDNTQISREQLDLTRGFIGKRGGGVLVLGARSFSKGGLGDSTLEEALPLQFSGRDDAVLPASTRGTNRVSLTAAGEGHPIMQLASTLDESRRRWDGVPALASTTPLGAARPGAAVLAVTGGTGGSSRALVAVQRYGEGRSMVFTGEASWRWRMMLPSTDRSFDTFWRQAVRWLALSARDPVAIETPVGASPGDTIRVRTLVRNSAFDPQNDASVELRVTDPAGKTQTLRADRDTNEDGSFVAVLKAGAPGVYRVAGDVRAGSSHATASEAAMLVGGADLEMADPRLNTQALERVALASGGRVITPADLSGVIDALQRRVPAARLEVTDDVWDTAWALSLVVLLLGAEWILRRRCGLR